MTESITLPYWFDAHAHFRQEELLQHTVRAHQSMGCFGFVAMPNTKPPVTRIMEANTTHKHESIEGYQMELFSWMKGPARREDIVVPLYLTPQCTVQQIEMGVETELLRAAKYYPPHGTTNSAHGAPLLHYMKNGVLKAMEDHGIILNIHGELHGVKGDRYFGPHGDAETYFYKEVFPRVKDLFPNLKIVAEHITTSAAVEAVLQSDATVGATITPQHLLFTIADLIQGFKYHLACMPVLKFEQDRHALMEAIMSRKHSMKFFAGTDSAPHTKKAMACGCAAGCFTGGTAPQLYAMAFEQHNHPITVGNGLMSWGATNLSENHQRFRSFLCENGPRFYDIEPPKGQTFVLERTPSKVERLVTTSGAIVPLAIGAQGGDDDSEATIPWSIKL